MWETGIVTGKRNRRGGRGGVGKRAREDIEVGIATKIKMDKNKKRNWYYYWKKDHEAKAKATAEGVSGLVHESDKCGIWGFELRLVMVKWSNHPTFLRSDAHKGRNQEDRKSESDEFHVFCLRPPKTKGKCHRKVWALILCFHYLQQELYKPTWTQSYLLANIKSISADHQLFLSGPTKCWCSDQVFRECINNSAIA